MNIVSWIQMRFQSAIQGLSSMKSIPYMADTLLPALFKQKKRTKRSTDRLKRLGGGRDTLTHYIYPSFVPPNFIYANL